MVRLLLARQRRTLNPLTAAISLAALLAAAPVAAHDAPPPRAVHVGGSAVVRAAPDRAQVALAVEQQGRDLAATEREVNAVVRRFLAVAADLGIPESALSTHAVRVNPEYQWDERSRKRVFTGYRVRRDLEVRLDDLERLGALLSGATEAGVNEVSPPALEHSRAQELEREALAQAAKDAQERARVLARSLGAKLGPVRSVSASGGSPPPMPYKRMAVMAEDAGGAGMGLSFGEIEFRADVQAEFALD